MTREPILSVTSPGHGTPFHHGAPFEVVGNAYLPVELAPRGASDDPGRAFLYPRKPESFSIDLIDAQGNILSHSKLELGEIAMNSVIGLFRKPMRLPELAAGDSAEPFLVELRATFRGDDGTEWIRSAQVGLRAYTTRPGPSDWSPATAPGGQLGFAFTRPGSRSRNLAGFDVRVEAKSSGYSSEVFLVLSLLNEDRSLVHAAQVIDSWRRTTRRIVTRFRAPDEPGTYRLVIQAFRKFGGALVESAEHSFRVVAARRPSAPLVDLNHASAEEIAALPGIGEAYAAEIIAMRPIDDLDDLRDISGVSTTTVEKIRPLVDLTVALPPL